MRNNKGVTLVALVITIIILLILAIVSIKLMVNAGIINKSEKAVNEYSQNSIDEKAKLLIASAKMINGGGTITIDSLKVVAEDEGIPYTENDMESIICTIEGKSVLIDINENITIGGEAVNWTLDDAGIIGLASKEDITNIKRIIIPGKIGNQTVIGIKAETFSDTAIEYVSIPKTINIIGEKAFYNCKYLTEIQMPGDVNVTADTFSGCTSIAKVTIIPSENSTEIGSQNKSMPWYQTNVGVEIVVSEGITKIGTAAFADPGVDNINHIEKVTISNTKILDTYVFSECINLTEITIGEGLEEIYGGAFNNCQNMISIILPKSIKVIQDNVFNNCGKLTNIHFRGDQNSVDIYTSWLGNCTGVTVTYNYNG